MFWDVVSGVENLVLAFGVPGTLFLAWYGIRTAARNERYAQYVTRYQEIISHLPYNVFAKGNGLITVENDMKAWLVAYIDLCAQELFDYLRRSIDGNIWKDWEPFILHDFKRSVPLREVFEEIKDDYPDLSHLLKNGKAPPKRPLWAG